MSLPSFRVHVSLKSLIPCRILAVRKFRKRSLPRRYHLRGKKQSPVRITASRMDVRKNAQLSDHRWFNSLTSQNSPSTKPWSRTSRFVLLTVFSQYWNLHPRTTKNLNRVWELASISSQLAKLRLQWQSIRLQTKNSKRDRAGRASHWMAPLFKISYTKVNTANLFSMVAVKLHRTEPLRNVTRWICLIKSL